ncbi:Protein C46C11.1 b [Aphelenchoides avenae]|nr:Protein C46C11.1 b [Aphelenchus avenae]
MICMCDMVVLRLISLLRKCWEGRESRVFRLVHCCKETEAYAAVLRFLVLAGRQVISAVPTLDPGCLFPPLEGDYSQYSFVFKGIESLDATCFYGRALGHQFTPSVEIIFRVIGYALAAFSLAWDKDGSAIGSLIQSWKMLLSPEEQATRIVKVTREANIQFCRAFWNLSELAGPQFYCPTMALNEQREVPLSGALPLLAATQKTVLIPEPTAHTGPRPVRFRILSAVHRKGLSPANASQSHDLSSHLVIHCHGGGYVSTSSKAHETYLRYWAKELNCPVVSIDYSLAPENPFPRPTEEVLYAYAYIVNNPEKFGWTGEKVVMVGDSAGGNLVVSANLRLIELGVQRRPDGLVLVYTPFLFQYLPSPSRILSFMDPLLHMGVIIRCAAAYTGAGQMRVEDDKLRVHDKEGSLLEDYVQKFQKAQEENRLEFSKNEHTMMSLLNISLGSNASEYLDQVKFNLDGSADALEAGEEGNSTTTEETLASERVFPSDGDTSAQGVQINADPSFIRLSNIRQDPELVDFLRAHPITAKAFGGEVENDDDAERQRSLSQSIVDTAVKAAGRAYDSFTDWFETPTKPAGHADKHKLAGSTHSLPDGPTDRTANTPPDSHVVDLIDLKLPRGHLISPMYASNDIVCQLPPTHFVGCHLDPLLDDTITFAKKLRSAGGKVRSVDLLDGVPHGFLNFAPMSPECRQGSDLCLKRLKEALESARGLPFAK